MEAKPNKPLLQSFPTSITSLEKWKFCKTLESQLRRVRPAIAVYPSIQLTALINPFGSFVPSALRRQCFNSVCDWVVVDFSARPLTVSILVGASNTHQREIVELASAAGIAIHRIDHRSFSESIEFLAKSLVARQGNRPFLHEEEMEVFYWLDEVSLADNLRLLPQVAGRSILDLHVYIPDSQLKGEPLEPAPERVERCSQFIWTVEEQVDFIGMTSVDFVVAEERERGIFPLLGIEFDGQRHFSDPRQRRKDCMKDFAFAEAGVPLVRIGSMEWGCGSKRASNKQKRNLLKLIAKRFMVAKSIWDPEGTGEFQSRAFDNASECQAEMAMDMQRILNRVGFTGIDWIRKQSDFGEKLLLKAEDPKGRKIERSTDLPPGLGPRCG